MKAPKQLGKYKIIRILDRGAMGLVYEGFDPSQQRRVALKTIHQDLLTGRHGQEILVRFRREAQAWGAFLHRNIVAIYEYNEAQETPFIALELVQGKKLKEYTGKKKRLEFPQIVKVLSQILDAIGYIHDKGMIHLDLKPANIILLEDNQVKVTDFGIAQVTNCRDIQTGAITGTPSYMSPEQFMGQRLDKRADLFSVGVILYELLTKEKPFPGHKVLTIMRRVLNTPHKKPSTLNPHLSKAFDVVIQKALAKRPADRFQDAESFWLAIEHAEKEGA